MRMFLEGNYRLLKFLITFLMAALIRSGDDADSEPLHRHGPALYLDRRNCTLLFVWIILIGAMIAVRDGTHF